MLAKRAPASTRTNCRGNLKKVGVLHARPPAPAVTAVTTYREPPCQSVLEGQGLCPCGGRGTRWRRYRVTKRGKLPTSFFFQKKEVLKGERKKRTPLTPYGGTGRTFFYFEGVLLITCSVSYSNALTCLTDLGMVYHLARPALRTVLTSSCPPSGRCSIAIQER